ncbi:MAG: hypothetical protein HN368_16285 [Spirochaetales bacterium]|nr:hypothetical protein [Spirochaetales bacterium]
MNSKRLPINSRPPLIGKLKHAYPLSLLSTSDTYLPWFFSNYIQLFYPKARGFPYATVDFFHPPQYPSLPLLDTQLFDRSVLEKIGPASLSKFLMRCLDDELYVRLYVDEFFIPDRSAYKRAYMPHRLLLFGYDRCLSCFDTIGFLKNGRYAVSQVHSADLERAFYSTRLMEEIHERERGERDPALGNLAEIWLARLKPGRQCQFDLQLVIEQLVDYLSSKNTAMRFRMLDTSYYGQEGSGMDVYGCIRRRLEYSLEHPDFCDFISLHILWEHKKCMLLRIRYMEEHRYLDPGDLLYEAYRNIESQAQILRMMILRFQIQRDRRIIERLIRRLDQCSQMEGAFLRKLLEKI